MVLHGSFSVFAIHSWNYCGPLLHEFHQHSFPVSGNSCHQLSGRQLLFELFGLFGEVVCIHYFDRSLVSVFTNEIHVSSPVTYTTLLRNSSLSLCYRTIKVKAKGILYILRAPVSIKTHLAQNLW
jgi:hypothetical protein